MGDAPDTIRDVAARESPDVQTMIDWFLERYEDVVESTPRDDGEWVYIHGEPVEPGAILDEEFSERKTAKIIERAAELLREFGEWVPVPVDEREPEPGDEARPKYKVVGDLGELVGRVTASVLADDAAVISRFRGLAIVTVCCLSQDPGKIRGALGDIELLLQDALRICRAMKSSTDAEWHTALNTRRNK